MTVLKAVIFDYGVLLQDDPASLDRIRHLLRKLSKLDIRIVVFSTYYRDINAELEERGLPDPDLFLFRDLVGSAKGTTEWVEAAASSLEVKPFQCAYVGDDRQDWREAINSGVFYMHAGWSQSLPQGITAVEVNNPLQVLAFITHFLLSPPRFEYRLDADEYGLYVRGLLAALTTLPASDPESFTLKDVFTYENEVRIRNLSARDLLMFHLVSSAYLEGLISDNSLFAVYPSHEPNKTSEVLGGFLKPISRLFHGFYKPDLLIRAEMSKDTSLERWSAGQAGREPDVSFFDQTDTVHVNPVYRNLIQSRPRNILVFDDFTSTGMSLEWARNLLYAAGAHRVVLLTVGKYPKRGQYSHTVHNPTFTDSIEPFQHRRYGSVAFSERNFAMDHDPKARHMIRQSFECWKHGKFYPVENSL